MIASQGLYSPAGSDQYFAAPRPGRNWAAMVDEPPLQSWEAMADANFEAAIAKNPTEEECIQLKQDSRPSILATSTPWSS
ncbi:hypothetical protein LguiB_009506 [Lonicera macranthoides]